MGRGNSQRKKESTNAATIWDWSERGGGAKASGAAATAAVARSRGSCNCCTKGRRGRAVLDEEEATSFRSGATQRGEQEVAAAAIRVVAMGERRGDLGVEVERHVAAQ